MMSQRHRLVWRIIEKKIFSSTEYQCYEDTKSKRIQYIIKTFKKTLESAVFHHLIIYLRHCEGCGTILVFSFCSFSVPFHPSPAGLTELNCPLVVLAVELS